IPEERVLIGGNGDVFGFDGERGEIISGVPSGTVLVDGLGVGDVGQVVLRDRQQLAQDGILIAVVGVRAGTAEIVSGPEIISRGFVYMREAEDLIEEVRRRAADAVASRAGEGDVNWTELKSAIRDALAGFLYEKTHRRPMIVPVVLEVEQPAVAAAERDGQAAGGSRGAARGLRPLHRIAPARRRDTIQALLPPEVTPCPTPTTRASGRRCSRPRRPGPDRFPFLARRPGPRWAPRRQAASPSTWRRRPEPPRPPSRKRAPPRRRGRRRTSTSSPSSARWRATSSSAARTKPPSTSTWCRSWWPPPGPGPSAASWWCSTPWAVTWKR